MEKVIVSEETNPVHIFEQKTLEKERVGTVVSRIYEGESVQRHLFFPAEGVAQKEVYSLGPTTTGFQFVDFTEAIEPFIEAGTLMTSRLWRGGTCYQALLRMDDYHAIKDPIQWDRELWNRKSNKLWDILELRASIKPGRGISVTRGFFRVVCENGLISKILGMGHWRFSHLNFNADEIISGASGGHTEIPPIMVGNKAGAARFSQLIDTEHEVEQMPYHLETSLNVLDRLPKWYKEDVQEQIGLFIQNSSHDRMGPLDLLNILTTPFNMGERTDGSVARLSTKLESIVKASSTFIGPFSLS